MDIEKYTRHPVVFYDQKCWVMRVISERQSGKTIEIMKWYAVVFILLIILILVLADAGRLPNEIAMFYSFHYGDKAGHFLLMGLLNFLVVMSFTFRRSANLAQVCLVCSLVVGVLVTLEEASQLFFASRTASWGDLLSSYAGIILFGILAFWLRARKSLSDIEIIMEGRIGE